MASLRVSLHKKAVWLLIASLAAVILMPTALAYAATPTGSWTDNTGDVSSFGGGDGYTAATSFTISSAEELAYAANLINKGSDPSVALPGHPGFYYKDASFKLTADIDLSAHYWTPISLDSVTAYQGTFDGAGHIITGLTIRTDQIPTAYTGYTAVGFFSGTGAYGGVKNLGILDCDIVASPTVQAPNITHVGGLIGVIPGHVANNDVDTCFVSGFVQGPKAAHVGGLVGYNGQGIIVDSLANVQVTSSYPQPSNVGAIVGLNTGSGSINRCSAFGVAEVTSTDGGDAVGGITGANNPGVIRNTFSSVEIRLGGSIGYAGGCVGYSNGTVGNIDSTVSFNNDKEQWVGGAMRDANNRSSVGAGTDETTPKKYTSAQMTASTSLATMGLSSGDWTAVAATTDTRYYPIPSKLLTGMPAAFVDAVKRLSSEKIPPTYPVNPNTNVPFGVNVTAGTYFSFGKYPQSKITDLSKLDTLTKDVDYVEYNGSFYLIEPLLWRVLTTPATNDSEHVTLVTNGVIDNMQYSRAGGTDSSEWRFSDLREWLCGTSDSGGKLDFLNQAYFETALYNAIVPRQTSGGALSRTQVLRSNQYPMPSDAAGSYESDYSAAVAGVAKDTPATIWTRTANTDSSLTTVDLQNGAWTYDSLASTGAAGVRPSLTVNLERTVFATKDDGSVKGNGTVSNPYVLEPRVTPHGGYATTTSKCDTCHSSHRAMGTATNDNNYLLPSKASDACIYCHIDTTNKSTNTKVYGGLIPNYQVNSKYGHNYNANATDYASAGQYGPKAGQGASCTDCHGVHGNGTTGNTYLDYMLLKAPDTSFDTAGPDAYAALTNNADWKSEPGETALSKWCVGCHTAPHQASTINAKHDSFACIDCHGADYGTSNYPHYVAGAEEFLLSADSAESNLTGAESASQDGVCLRCHRQSASSEIETP